MDEDRSRLIDDLRLLADETAAAAPVSVDVSDADTVDEVLGRLEEYFKTPGTPAAVTLIVDAARVGVVTRRAVERSGRTAADPGTGVEVGAGERGQLPGVSTRYRLLEFDCRRCHAVAYRISYDARNLPACASHGPMELRRGS